MLGRKNLSIEIEFGLRLVIGLGQKFLIRFGSDQFSVARVGSAIYGLALENFPYKCQFF